MKGRVSERMMMTLLYVVSGTMALGAMLFGEFVLAPAVVLVGSLIGLRASLPAPDGSSRAYVIDGTHRVVDALIARRRFAVYVLDEAESMAVCTVLP